MKRAFLLSLLFLTHLAVWADEPRTNDPVAPQVASGSTNGHEWVDLGLSVKWATCNVGASTPAEYGNYFAWGETSVKWMYWDDDSATYEKSMGDIAGNPDYDAARANWGDGWRLPTQAEFRELIDKCTWTWTSQGGHNGYKVTGKNGNSIFLPAAGWCIGPALSYAGKLGFYWSSSPFGNDSQRAGGLCFRNDSGCHVEWGYRYYGDSVRPVMDLTPSERQSMAATEEQAWRAKIAAGKMHQINGYYYVDLGLSVKWATCNIGANYPWNDGDYYAWGETNTKSEYTAETSTSYNKSMGDIAGNPTYDAARAKWGGSWRMPTKKEMLELIDKCTWRETVVGGCRGYQIIGPNRNSIFLPLAGWKGKTGSSKKGEQGLYWSSTSDSGELQAACGLLLRGGGSPSVMRGTRNGGTPIRPVTD